MKAKNALRLIHKIQEQSSLFDIIKFRGIHSGTSFSSKDNAELNDLLISELSLITRDSQDNFESKKLHLLFQSFFFIHVSDYKSSLKSFYDLNKLFETNESVWSFPPYDYLSTLEGVLDSLRTIKFYDDMKYYIEKIESLTKQNYPESFQIIALQIVFIYKLTIHINKEEITQAKQLAETIPTQLLKNPTLVDFEKLTELHFNIGLIYFLDASYQKAIKHFNILATMVNVNYDLAVYKVSRLLYVIIHYELKNTTYLDYEIRSYKRTFQKSGKVSMIERLILLIVKFDPKRKSKIRNALLWKKVSVKLAEIEKNRYEKQILKYYDFGSWIQAKLLIDRS